MLGLFGLDTQGLGSKKWAHSTSTTQFIVSTPVTVKEAGGTSEIEVLIGVLTAVTLLLLFLFIVVLAYSRRQKLLNSPASRSPFPVQINMKVSLNRGLS